MEEKKTVTIDQLDLLNHATAFGLLNKVLEEEDARLSPKPHMHETITLFSALFMLPKGLGNELWEAAAISMMDALKLRILMKGSKNEVVFPEWDPEDKDNAEIHKLCDVFFMEYAWTLLDRGAVDLPDHSLGALFTLSGVCVEGISRGYKVSDENMKELKEQYKETFYNSMGGGQDKEKALLSQLDSLEQIYLAHRAS